MTVLGGRLVMSGWQASDVWVPGKRATWQDGVS